MAELAAIGGALNLLQEALSLAKQAYSRASEIFSAISNVESRINDHMTRELNVMQAFLEHIDTDQSNDILAAWIKEVRKVKDQIIDIQNEFTYQVNKQKVGSSSFVLKRIFKEQMSLVYLIKLSDRLDEVDNSLKHLDKMKSRYSITNVGNSSTSRKDANAISVQVANSAHFIDEREIVGIDENRKKLTSMINSKESDRSIITVCGMPGIGKTILVTNVFQRERQNFSCQAWVCISQTYEVDQVLRNLISEICKNRRTYPINTENKNTGELKETVRNLLQQGKYLIVLDDVWNKDFYENISEVFVENHDGSRIVITSRITNLASLSREHNRLKLDPLSEDESWKLFCRKAFPSENECSPHLHNWAKMIVSKCNGLPLALVSLGSVMSSCDKIESEWKRVHDELRLELENNKSLDRLRNVLQLSFNHLPNYLQNCFLYCSMFPEDYHLARKKLIRLWIAEGFIEKKGRSTLEETAEGYLLDLINRNMLQVVQRNDSGRVKRCQMHDTLRELAISICMNKKFGLLCEDNGPIDIDRSVSRLFIIKSDNRIGHAQLKQLQTLMSFDLSLNLSPLITTEFVNCRYLKVLNLEDLSIQSVPDNIGHLLNLHYFGLRNTKVELLPNSIKKLTMLQTLDLCKTKIEKLPNEIVRLTKLRHIFAESVVDEAYKSFRNRKGIYLPGGMLYLKELQTLQAVESDDTIVTELGNLTQLRSLGIRNVDQSHSAELCRSISKMQFLHSLYIFAKEENILALNNFDSPPLQLRKLWLFGKLEYNALQSPLFQISGKFIQQLYLGWSGLSSNPLPKLAHLENLTSLFLNRAYSGTELSFHAGWFPRLKKLGLINMPYLEQVEMKNDTMKSIETIVFQDMKSLRFPQGVEHLRSLKSILCDNLSPNFGVSVGVHKFGRFSCIIYG